MQKESFKSNKNNKNQISSKQEGYYLSFGFFPEDDFKHFSNYIKDGEIDCKSEEGWGGIKCFSLHYFDDNKKKQYTNTYANSVLAYELKEEDMNILNGSIMDAMADYDNIFPYYLYYNENDCDEKNKEILEKLKKEEKENKYNYIRDIYDNAMIYVKKKNSNINITEIISNKLKNRIKIMSDSFEANKTEPDLKKRADNMIKYIENNMLSNNNDLDSSFNKDNYDIIKKQDSDIIEIQLKLKEENKSVLYIDIKTGRIKVVYTELNCLQECAKNGKIGVKRMCIYYLKQHTDEALNEKNPIERYKKIYFEKFAINSIKDNIDEIVKVYAQNFPSQDIRLIDKSTGDFFFIQIEKFIEFFAEKSKKQSYLDMIKEAKEKYNTKKLQEEKNIIHKNKFLLNQLPKKITDDFRAELKKNFPEGKFTIDYKKIKDCIFMKKGLKKDELKKMLNNQEIILYNLIKSAKNVSIDNT